MPMADAFYPWLKLKIKSLERRLKAAKKTLKELERTRKRMRKGSVK